MTNAEFAKTNRLKYCCEAAGIKPTKRQASKFRMKRGLAYAARQEGLELENDAKPVKETTT